MCVALWYRQHGTVPVRKFPLNSGTLQAGNSLACSQEKRHGILAIGFLVVRAMGSLPVSADAMNVSG